MAIQPPQRFELDDLAHVEREARTIYAPGATPGDVLVVQSDHSLVAAPGGGSSPVKQSPPVTMSAADLNNGTPVTIVTATPGKVYVPIGVLCHYHPGDTGFTVGAFSGLSVGPLSQLGEVSGIITSTDEWTTFDWNTAFNPAAYTIGAQAPDTMAADLVAQTGGVSGGNGTLDVAVVYLELDIV